MKPWYAYLVVMLLALQADDCLAAVLYVDLNSTNPVSPYSSWSTAATNIQNAVDAASAGDTVLVTNGVYATGGRTVPPYLLTNRVVVNKPITLQSVNGPEVTIIQGYQVPTVTNGDSAVRCIYMTNNAALIGFTLTNGATLTNGGFTPDPHDDFGGGVWCESLNALIVNCIVIGNAAKWHGGGAVAGTFSNCNFTANAAGINGYGGGAYQSTLNNCSLTSNTANYGGGATSSTLNSCILTGNSATDAGGAVASIVIDSIVNNCILTGNSATLAGGATHYGTINNSVLANNTTSGDGGGAYGGTLNYCLIISNMTPSTPVGIGYGGGTYGAALNNCRVVWNGAGQYGGGSYGGTLNNCLLSSNYVVYGFGGGCYNGTLNNCTVTGNNAGTAGGGTYLTTLYNCIVYYNSAPQQSNYSSTNLVNYSCTTPTPTNRPGCITNAPLFIDPATGNYRLKPSSPCINTGTNTYVTSDTDLDGNARIADGKVDMGAYEFQVTNIAAYLAWLQQNGLATDGSADFSDPDQDGLNNYQEWRAGTNPTNAASVLLLGKPAPSGTNIIVTWQSVINRNYYLQRSANLGAQPVFQPLATNLVGQAGTTSYMDSTATNGGPYYYRVGVQ